jgi:Fe-S-cluster containining protein
VSDAFDCLTCGACCVANVPEQTAYAETTWTDERRLGRSFVRLNVLRPTRAGMTERGMRVPHGAVRTVQRGGHTVCVALDGTVGGKVSCSVYARRPRVCRSSCEPGDDVCRMHRRQHGIDVPAVMATAVR